MAADWEQLKLDELSIKDTPAPECVALQGRGSVSEHSHPEMFREHCDNWPFLTTVCVFRLHHHRPKHQQHLQQHPPESEQAEVDAQQQIAALGPNAAELHLTTQEEQPVLLALAGNNERTQGEESRGLKRALACSLVMHGWACTPCTGQTCLLARSVSFALAKWVADGPLTWMDASDYILKAAGLLK